MKATLATLGALVPLACLPASLAAQCTPCYVCSPALCVPLPVAPSLCNTPGFYVQYPDGTVYGPNYYLRPPYPPFNGILPGPTGQAIRGHTQRVSHPGSMPFAAMPGGMPPSAMPTAPGGMPHPYAMMPPGGMPPGMMAPGMMAPGMMPAPGGMPPLAGLMPPPAGPFDRMDTFDRMERFAAPPASDLGPKVNVIFPSHPYVRSPRDFFMWRENMEDRLSKESRPRLIP